MIIKATVQAVSQAMTEKAESAFDSPWGHGLSDSRCSPLSGTLWGEAPIPAHTQNFMAAFCCLLLYSFNPFYAKA